MAINIEDFLCLCVGGGEGGRGGGGVCGALPQSHA